MAKQLWLTPDILKWSWINVGSTVYAEEGWRRPYAHWQHAEQLIANAASEFVRTDVVTTLKRAVDHRIRALMGLYNLRSLPLRDKPSVHLELLAHVGLVRPLMVQQLLSIRNAVEHEDAAPPSENECRMYAEFTWYFLRSTDRVIRSSVNSVEVELPDVDEDDSLPYPYYYVELRLGPDHGWILRIFGLFKAEWVATEHREGWLHVHAKQVESGVELVESLKNLRKADYRLTETRVNPTDAFFDGELRGPRDSLLEIYRRYFDLE